ncbi:MAG: YqeG family HAD IIIA-type phosphatase [Cyanobacteria bacterium]|nr:YqeG family HAD IIIA-type phosphatase [Cyanobacteria bacterium bin.51]
MRLQRLLQPSWMLDTSLAELPLERLFQGRIKALILDVDRTLLPRHRAELPPLMEQWLRRAQQTMRLHLFSNNPSRRRIGAVAKRLELPFTTSAGKPRRSALRKVLAELGLPPNQVAMVGDRLFTDVLAGNRLGLFTVLVKPVDPQGQPCQRDHLQRAELRLARWIGTRLDR